MYSHAELRIREATAEDVPIVLQFIRGLAEYEKALDRVSATEAIIQTALFGPEPRAKALIVSAGEELAAFAIYFFSFSSFTGLPNLYIEDIFVRPSHRGLGV